jgi:hypothetical protein
MSHGTLYDNFIRIAPAVSYEGKVIADVLSSSFDWQRVAVFYTLDDQDCADLNTEFSERAVELNMDVVVNIKIQSEITDFSNIISGVLPMEPKVIVLFMKPAIAAPFLEAAYKMGLLTTGVTVVGTTYTSSSALYSSFSQQADIPSILKGYIGVQSNMNWTGTAVGRAFIERWRRQNNTVSYNAQGEAVCDTTMDDDNSFYYYQARVNYDESKSFVCAGLNFSQFNVSNIYLYAGFAYDAIYTAAYAMHDLLYNQGVADAKGLSGKLMKESILDADPFDGVTGSLSFSRGRTKSKTYGVGDRITGYGFNVINFDPGSYVNANSSQGFAIVGTCESDGVVAFSSAVKYNTVTGVRGSDSPPDLIVTMPISIQNILSGFGWALIVATFICIAYCYVFRNDNAIRVAQPTLLFWTFVGCLLICGRLIVLTTAISTAQCTARLYTSHLAFYVLLGSVMAKMWRLHLLCNVSAIRPVDTSERAVLTLFFVGLAVMFFYLVLLTSISPPAVGQVISTAVTGQRTIVKVCTSSLVDMEYALLTVEVLMLFSAIGLCLAIANAPERVNESSTSAYIIALMFVFIAAYCVQTFVTGIDPITVRIAFGSICIVIVSIVLIFTMMPKTSIVLTHVKRVICSRRVAMSAVEKLAPGDIPYLDDIPQGSTDRDRLKFGTKDERKAICSKHLMIWHTMLVAATNSDFKSSNGNGKGSQNSQQPVVNSAAPDVENT